MTAAELAEVVAAHGKWRRGEPGGIRANLAGANLARAYLADAYLAGANLTGANLARANLARANLARANLAGANLAGANLADAYLTDANLTDANLTDAYLTGANLARANLAGANLAGANLARANLARAKGIDGIRASLGIELDPSLPRRIVEQIEAHPDTWDQASWHSTCGTKHCIAGWAVTLGPNGKELEKRFGTSTAATLLLAREGVEMPSFDGGAGDETTIGRLKAFPEAKS